MTAFAARSAAHAAASQPHAPVGAIIWSLASFLAALAAGCALLRSIAPFPEVHGIYPKWAYFQRHRDEFDLLFIGSSRFNHHIIPRQFDDALAAAGRPLRSFNFGYDGMWPPESFYLLRRLLGLHPARLKWVIIDLMDIRTALDERNVSTRRMAYWHDWRHTRLAFREIRESRRRWQEQCDLLTGHARFCMGEALNLGRGSELLEQWLNPRPPRRKPYVWESRAGFEPGSEEPFAGEARTRFEEKLRALSQDLHPRPLRPVFHDALRELISDVRRAGAEPIFVIAPTINLQENFSKVPDAAAVIALNDPVAYPQLFDPDLRYDSWHLNERGAVVLTSILAQACIDRDLLPKMKEPEH